MPADQRGWLYHSQCLVPVEPAREPDQGETGGVSGALSLDVAFLIQRQLFAQKEIFCGKCGAGAQAIAQERRQQTYKRHEGTEPVRKSCHRQGVPHRYGLLSLAIIPAREFLV